MMNRKALFLALCLMISTRVLAGGLALPTRSAGLGFGNLQEFSGVRFNLSDREVSRVAGINTTFWVPKNNKDAVYHGINLGLLGVSGHEFRGITAGLMGVDSALTRGLALGGLGVEAGDLKGLAAGGLGVAAQDVSGIALGGLGVGAEDVTGIVAGGLGIGAQDVKGLAIGGLGVGGHDLQGLFLGGLGVGGNSLTGVAVGGLGVGAHKVTGIMIGGLGVGGQEVTGLALSLGYLKAEYSFTGLGTAAYTNITYAKGLTIGIFNRADVLQGVQIGLLNYAGNNPDGLRWLPGVNAHF